jgi:ribonucleoside-diphosphate reductase alpha chain
MTVENGNKMANTYYEGPKLPISIEIDEIKYRDGDETFDGKIRRLARSMSDNAEHEMELQEIFGNLRFLPAGRVQNAMGSRKITSAYNCFVSGEIEDSMDAIMTRAAEAAETMRRGGGIGYDFSKLRPKGALIKSLQSKASGPVSFMGIYDAVCQTIASSGHRRGAQMGVLRVDHPDIFEFLRAKRNSDKLTGFNVSVGVTDLFMETLKKDDDSFDLVFDGVVYRTVSARELWDEIMLSTWDWAEPGVLFIDCINSQNNLWYIETIGTTNPCGEQPLPPNGACLLGSFNVVSYLEKKGDAWVFDYTKFKADIPHIVRAMDNVIDRTIYPLKAQEDEAKSKRRMGLGLTGAANAGEMLGFKYGSEEFLEWLEGILKLLRNGTYRASSDLAAEKGAFPLWDAKWLDSGFAKTLPYRLRKRIKEQGMRNSHLTSIAPTGTISLVAENVSSGIEPVFSHYYDRTIQTFEGPKVERVSDFAYRNGVKGVTANELSVKDHVAVLALCQHYVDSAVSKTCNVGDDVTFEEFKDVYYNAWELGCKGITTFRAAGKRYGILNEVKEEATEEEEGAEACFIDPVTGQKGCSL